MKQFLVFSFLGLFIAAGAKAAKDPRTEAVIHVESCEAILQEFMSDPVTTIPASVWQQARALLIVNQFKAGFLLGINDGYAVIMAKQADGKWSVPVLLTASEASIGLQLGAKSVETIYVMTDDRTPRLLFNQRFSAGVDAKAVAGPTGHGVEKDSGAIAKGPILVYTKATGLFAGATLKAGYVVRNDPANFALYSTTETLPELLYSNWFAAPAEVQPLMHYVQHLSP